MAPNDKVVEDIIRFTAHGHILQIYSLPILNQSVRWLRYQSQVSRPVCSSTEAPCSFSRDVCSFRPMYLSALSHVSFTLAPFTVAGWELAVFTISKHAFLNAVLHCAKFLSHHNLLVSVPLSLLHSCTALHRDYDHLDPGLCTPNSYCWQSFIYHG